VTPRRLIEPARLAGSAVLRTQSDDRLVDLVREGNERAFEAVVHRYRRPLLRYCGRFLSPARAEDAVQQAFVNAYGALRDSSAEIRLRPWLYRIAHNSALNVLRQAGADHLQVDEQMDGVETPPQALERGERFRAVVAAVQDLPARQRDAIVLQALEGRSYEEIASELGVSDGAVRQLLNRARTTLREAATAVTPLGLVMRFGGAVDAPIAERVAQVVVGAGGGAALAKGMAVVAVGGAVVGGTAAVGPGGGERSDRNRPAAAAIAPDPRGGGDSGGAARSLTPVGSDGPERRGGGSREDRGGGGDGDRGREGRGGRGGDEQGGRGDDDDEGQDRDDDRSGHGGGDSDSDDDRSGHGGDSDSDDDRSGHGGGGDDAQDALEADDDNSGPGGGGDDLPEVDDSPDPPEVDDDPEDSSGPGSGGSSDDRSGRGAGESDDYE
jgi:RNA polymerase sigma factor (sigma-70 family)